MKNLLLLLLAPAMLVLGSCTKNEIATFTAAEIEWDAASWNANSTGLSYPLLNRVPVMGFATTTANSPALTRNSGTVRLRVNLMGAQLGSDKSFSYQVVSGESTAKAGVHYEALNGTGTIAANSSYGYVDVKVLNAGSAAGSVVLVLQLLGNEGFHASPNYSTVGLVISQL